VLFRSLRGGFIAWSETSLAPFNTAMFSATGSDQDRLGDPIYGALALKSLYALASASALCVVTYVVAYKRHAQSILEAENGPLSSHDGVAIAVVSWDRLGGA